MMDWKYEIRERLAGVSLDATREAEIVEELGQHLEDRYAELLASGANTEEAHRAVRAELSESELLAVELARVERPVIREPIVLRTGEIGLRMALGAQRRDIFRLVIGQGLKLTLTGIGIGAAVSLALTRFLSSLLVGVSPGDPLTFITLILLFSLVALLACYIPGRRATKVDPMVALRCE